MARMSTFSAARSRTRAPAHPPSITRSATRRIGGTTTIRIVSDSDEELPAVHPVQHQPEDQQRQPAHDDRLVCGAEHLKSAPAEMRPERLRRVLLGDVYDDVHCDGVQADDEEGEAPAAPA